VPEPLVDARAGLPSLDLAGLGRALLETDRRYFELGALRRELPGAEMLWLEGMADLPAAGVVHRVVPAETVDSAEWVGEVTAALLDTGFRHGRIYFDGPSWPLEAQLASDGWTMRREPGLVALANVPRRTPDIELVPVLSDDGWAAKEHIHRADAVRPDGHDAPASQWVAMEKVRVATGELEAWLVVRQGIVCGTVCTMVDDVVLRNKNLVVHPDHRRTGVGLGVLAKLDDMARVRGLVLGTFSVAGEDGELLYRAANMSVVVEQREWSRPLEWT
jgi:GNAT superfamily N-acetyltransferase